MPTIDTSTLIHAPLDRIYTIAKDCASYPDFMKDVQSVTIVEQAPGKVIADYVGLVPQFRLKVRWRQEELWDDNTYSSRFKQIKGDYDSLEGTWKFTVEGNSVRFDQHLEYEYNVPTLGALVKKVIHSIIVKNLDNIGSSIKQRAEQAG